MKKSTVLYSVAGHTGAHMLIDVRAAESGEIADVQLIGALLPFSVPIADLTPFTPADRFPSQKYATLASLAQEAVTVYGLDPARVQRAVMLLQNRTNVQQARYDELGEAITPSLDKLIVKAESKPGWYVVTRGVCNCKDHSQGNVCKHRIAAWIFREVISRNQVAARRHTSPISVKVGV